MCGLHQQIPSFYIKEFKKLISVFKNKIKRTRDKGRKIKETQEFQNKIRNVIRDSLIGLGMHSQADAVYIVQMDLRKTIAWYQNIFRWLGYAIWKIFLNYNVVFKGVLKVLRFLSRVIILICVFGFLFFLFEMNGNLVFKEDNSPNILSCIYFSFLVFTSFSDSRFTYTGPLINIVITSEIIFSISFTVILAYLIGHEVARQTSLPQPKWETQKLNTYFDPQKRKRLFYQ